MSADFLTSLPLSKYLLEEYSRAQTTGFPGGGKINFAILLQQLHDYLNKNVHPTVQQRNTLADSDAYLTDHGPAHIEQVMRRASAIVKTRECLHNELKDRQTAKYSTCLHLYEVFLLLAAIHFHDVGNMYGRAGHEEEILRVMDDVACLHDLPIGVRRDIAQIAQCHGGTFRGSKNTIQRLPAGEASTSDAYYRPQLLAGVLRLADELADDSSRADNFGLKQPGELPPTCLIFHKYAAALQVSISPLEGRIELRFDLNADDLSKPFQKKGATGDILDVYLLDEIYERTLKTYAEMDYCSRYMRELHSQFNTVAVRIHFYHSLRNSSEVCEPVRYTIGDRGYPKYSGSSTAEILEHLASGFAGAIRGVDLAAKLAKPA